MRLLAGTIALVAGVIGLLFVLLRITNGVENWFITSGAGDVLMWSLVAALTLTFFAIPAGAFGVAARMWLVRMREGEYLESTPHALLTPARPRSLAEPPESLEISKCKMHAPRKELQA